MSQNGTEASSYQAIISSMTTCHSRTRIGHTAHRKTEASTQRCWKASVPRARRSSSTISRAHAWFQRAHTISVTVFMILLSAWFAIMMDRSRETWRSAKRNGSLANAVITHKLIKTRMRSMVRPIQSSKKWSSSITTRLLELLVNEAKWQGKLLPTINE